MCVAYFNFVKQPRADVNAFDGCRCILPRCTSPSMIFKTHFLRNNSQDRRPLTSVACLHCKLLRAINLHARLSDNLGNYITSPAGTLDRRYTGDTHDPVGLREKVERIAACHQTDGEMPRRSQAGSRERRKENRKEQGASGIARGASTRTTEEAEAPPWIRGRRGES